MTTSVPAPAILMSLILVIGSAPGVAKVYQWTDADGNVQFSDRAPDPGPTSAQAAQAGRAPSGQTGENPDLAVRVVPVEFYLHDRIVSMIESIPRAVNAIYLRHFGLNPPLPSPLKVRVFADQAAYDRFVGPAAAAAEPGGRFSADTNELATWYRPSPDAMAQAVADKTSRVLLHSRFPSAPVWLREGLPRYFQMLRIAGDATVVFPAPHLEQALRTLRDTDQLLPIARLLTLSAPEWERENQTNQRAAVQSWALVYFLLSKPEGGPLVAEILQRSAAAPGDDAVSIAVIDPRFPGGVAALDSRWRDWIGAHKEANSY